MHCGERAPVDVGSARRRRERRLRCFLRHEEMTVRMAVVAAVHHSAYLRPSTTKSSRTFRCRARERGRVHQYTVEQIGHVPIPQTHEQIVENVQVTPRALSWCSLCNTSSSD